MPRRGSPAWRHPDNPMAGVLADVKRGVRNAQRDASQAQRDAADARRAAARIARQPGAKGDPGPQGPEGPPGQPVDPPLATVEVTGNDGRATWIYPEYLEQPPVVAATPLDSVPDGKTTYTVVLEHVDADRAIARVWRTRPLLGLGLLPSVPAGAGIPVHLLAVPIPADSPGEDDTSPGADSSDGGGGLG